MELRNLDIENDSFGLSLGVSPERVNYLCNIMNATIERLNKIEFQEHRSRTFELLVLECETLNEVVFVCSGFSDFLMTRRARAIAHEVAEDSGLQAVLDVIRSRTGNMRIGKVADLPQFITELKQAAEKAKKKSKKRTTPH